MKRTILLLVLLITLAIAYAQVNPWTNYTNKNTIRAIVQEGNYVWIGTSGGLVKYNKITGDKTNYNVANSGLPLNSVYAIKIDAQGNKWIGTGYEDNSRGGLSKFDGSNWTTYSNINSPLPGCVYSIDCDSLGNIWAGTQNGLVKFDGTDWVIYTPDNSGLASPIIYSIGVDNNGIIWSGTAYNGLFRFDGTNWSSHHDPQGYTQGVGAIVFDATGLMWLSIYQPYGMGAVASYNGTDWNVYSYADIGLDMFFVNTIAFESNGNMWIGTNSGMARFNGQIWTTYLTTTSELLNNYVGYICIDENNVKWIGTGGSGIQTLDNNIWNSIDISDTSLPCNQISSLKVDTQDRLIFATQHGLCAFNGANWTGFEDNPYNVYNAIVSVATDSNNNIWFSYANGIIGNFNGSAYTYQDVNDIILDFNTLYAITVDQQNRLWVGTNNCIMEYNPPGWTIYAGANGYPGGHPRYMCFDNLGNLLLGTETNGLIKHYGNYWASYNNTNSSLPYNSIHSLFVDSVGNAWMGCFLDNTSNCTTAALVKFDGYTFTIYHQVPNGIPCDKINAITQDNNGVMWFGSAEGLIKYAFGQWTLFHLDNSGILNNDKITTMACDSQNNIWMGTEQSGVLVFDGAYVSNDEQVLNLDNIFKIAPNPIKDNTNISFDLAKSGKTDISIYNLKGQKVTTLANATLGKGKHNYIWNLKDANGNKVCSGVYLIKMTNDGKSRTSKCLVLK